MNLIKTSLLTAISTVIKIASGFVINKIVSIYVGPSGLAVIGQLQNFVSVITTFSNGATNQGIVKYTAEHKDTRNKQHIFSTSIVISVLCSSLISIFLIAFSDFLSVNILKDSQYFTVFILFGATVFLFALNSVLMSILNGQREIKKYIFVNICSSVFSLLLTSCLIIALNLLGALYALVINQSVIFFITLYLVRKSEWFKIEYFLKGFDKDSFRNLSKYSIMAITSAITVPVSHLLVRNYIGENLSWDDAGYWQGIWYISSMYLMVITTSLSVYYLPRLSEIKNDRELKLEIYNGYKVIIPIVTILSLMIFLLKEYIVIIAFSEKFLPMKELFAWQMIGDVIKISSWLLGYLTIAKAMTKTFVFLEILGSSSFVILSVLCIDEFGLVGITYAYAINYTLYLIVICYIFRKILK
ncbi:O-antigen translocase [Vibrio aestuarianus]|uniref:O-antigen translocase n=1 Tax=Vibrio aestuarianus TaxID=28171 RepID=UPI001559C7C0|nr:O-antigen translocase [Vibrio aestuarianus]NGZ15531.1 O-antigen translocase [Vibrio aestuarianus]NKZ51679.1 O-antigen translocase [Vibrio aestuarianus]